MASTPNQCYYILRRVQDGKETEVVLSDGLPFRIADFIWTHPYTLRESVNGRVIFDFNVEAQSLRPSVELVA